jgi:hypothetical protein
MSTDSQRSAGTSPSENTIGSPDMADWAILNWVKKSNERSKVWAILPIDTRAALPLIDESGHWDEFRRIQSTRFAEYGEAREAIAQDGYYFTRESTAIGPLTGTPD